MDLRREELVDRFPRRAGGRHADGRTLCASARGPRRHHVALHRPRPRRHPAGGHRADAAHPRKKISVGGRIVGRVSQAGTGWETRPTELPRSPKCFETYTCIEEGPAMKRMLAFL